MKLRFLSILVVILVSVTACQNDNKKSKKKDDVKKETTKKTDNSSKDKVFDAEEYGFSLQFPKKPKTKTTTQQTKVGEVTTATYSCDTDYIQYMVIASKMPKMVMLALNQEQLIEQAKKGAFAVIEDEKVLSEKKITVGGHPGLEMEVEGNYKGVESYTAVRMYMIDNKQINIFAVCEKSKMKKAEIFKFLDSFKLK